MKYVCIGPMFTLNVVSPRNQEGFTFKTQSLIASDSMSIANGSTEVVPCSHLLENLDVALHNKDIYNSFEPYFMNVTLNQVNERSRT